jgi:Pentapeptide repeats (8 copies)
MVDGPPERGDDDNTKTQERRHLVRRLAVVAAGVLVLLVLLVLVVVVVLPPRFTVHRTFDKDHEELKAQNDVRTTLLQGLGALLVLTGAAIGASVAYRGVQETRRQIAQTADDNQEQFTLTRQGQVTDRYTKAVDQLGSEHLDVRLGGIYALERIARDSPPDRATVEEVLTAYVRGHAPWPPPPAPPSLQAITRPLVTFAQRQRWALRQRTAKATAGQGQQGQRDEKVAEPQWPPADVQAAVTVLGRRQLPPDGPRVLDLIRVDLRLTELPRANLQGARLEGANLQGAGLIGANLEGAFLIGANLQRAILLGANLQRASLGGAKFQGARLMDANLQGAFLGNAKLQGARLARAKFRGAWLHGTNLRGALLHGADFQGATFDNADLHGARADKATHWPNGFDPQTAGVTIHQRRHAKRRVKVEPDWVRRRREDGHGGPD